MGEKVGGLDVSGGFAVTVFDCAGRVRMITDPVGNETQYVRDALGREIVNFDPAGKATTTTYDTVSRVSTVTDRLGRSETYNYDAGNRMTLAVWKSAAGATVNLLTYTYNNADSPLPAADYNGTLTYTHEERK